VPLAAHRDSKPSLGRVADHAPDIVDRFRTKHRDRPMVHDVAAIVGGGFKNGILGQQDAVERRQCVETPLRGIDRCSPAAAQRIESDDESGCGRASDV
jgi:hypothetical protein